MDNNFEMGRRLKSERERLNLLQTDIVDKLGVSVPALSTYENGKRQPKLDLLASMAGLGYDVHFVITGERVGALQSDLSTDEVAWLELYRQLRSDDRERLIKMAKSLL